METPDSAVNPLFPNYASENLKPGQTYKVLSRIYKVGYAGDVFTVLDVKSPENPVCEDGKKYYAVLRYMTSRLDGVQEMFIEKWGSLDHTLMYSLLEIRNDDEN